MSNTEKVDFEKKDPFNSKYDKLNRKQIADNLTLILKNRDDSFVLSIDSGWGTGKTTFIEMWAQQLQNQGEMIPIYFNAWENDDFDDPLLAIIANFNKIICDSTDKKVKLDSLKLNAEPLLKKGLPFLIKRLSKNILDAEGLEILAESFGIQKTVNAFEDYEKYTAEKDVFKAELKNFQETMGKKIVLFIDELDRCRPSFAIETLERIKHYFDISGFIFVLSVDREQLSHSIATLYGQNMDSQGYLRRFIDLEYRLPEPDIYLYMKFMIGKNVNNSKININLKYFWEILISLVPYFEMSLRDINKLFEMLGVFLPLSDLLNNRLIFNTNATHDKENMDNWYLCSAISAYFCLLKVRYPNFYIDVVNKKIRHFHLSSSSNDNDRNALQKMALERIKIETQSHYYNKYLPEIIKNFYDMYIRENEEEISQFRFYQINEEGFQQKLDLFFLWNRDGNKREMRIFKQLGFVENFGNFDFKKLKEE